jgi:hypothetical protein
MKFIIALIIDTFAAVLSWIGGQGTRAVAALVIIGIAAPSIGAVVKPYVTEAVFVLLCIAFLRVDIASLNSYLRRPTLVLAATAWTSVVVPILFGLCCGVIDLRMHAPDLFLSLMLQGVASPMMAAPALAALMGLDATLVLATLVTSSALIPLTAPLFALIFIGPSLTISPLALGIKLFGILAGAAAVGIAVRRLVGLDAIERHNDKIDGFNILILFVFVAAIMENLGASFLAAPLITIALAGLAFAVFFAVLFVTALLFMRAGREQALALAFMASQRNLGLMLAATGGALPELTWLYFALSQFPIYLSPHLLRPLARRARRL